MHRAILVWCGLLVFICAIITVPAGAAAIEVVHVDRSGFAIITVRGELEARDGGGFADIAQRFTKAVVVFDSPGGSVIAGLQMGQIIGLRHFATFSPEGALCASACAIAWMAGAPRLMQPDSRIGFHAAYNKDTHEQTGVGNALIGAYLNRLGLSDDAIIYIEQAAPSEITWLTAADARRLEIAVTILPSSGPARPAETSPAARPAPPPSAPPPPARSPAAPAEEQPRPLPLLVEPLRTPPSDPLPAATLEQQAVSFAGDYFAHWSESNDAALGFFVTAYAPNVAFYGQSIDRTLVLQQKRAYVVKWPVRVYTARPQGERAFCNAATATCVVTGIVDWDCRSPERRVRSTGAANFSLTIAFTGGTSRILAESGSVIERSVN